ncbi:xanthine dehydrogenase family protein molybdopterin-binding subunit [Oecophyllibacter saccharovorans]|nr:xanthine dehydrogenase family protein molybdopterin-binding subunit [Oecophyllibacter saccharovorans]
MPVPPRPRSPRSLSRRQFLLEAAGGSLAFGFLPTCAKAEIVLPPLPERLGGTAAQPSELTPNLWCVLHSDGWLDVNIARAEMGQHVGTALASVLADEMGMPWNRVRIIQVDTEQRFWPWYATGGSRSVWSGWVPYRQAGLAARLILTRLAAPLLNAAPQACTVADGQVSCGERAMSFGEIVAACARPGLQMGYTAEELAALKLPPVAPPQTGRSLPALDIPPKVTGAARYGIDARLPGQLYARPLLPPTRYGARILSLDDSQARSLKGYHGTLQINDPENGFEGWAIVLADSWPTALRASACIKVHWQPGPTADVSEADIARRAQELCNDRKAGTIVQWGGPKLSHQLEQAPHKLEREYWTQPVAHFAMEPVNCLAHRNSEGVWEIHTGCQAQKLIMPQIAQALGIPAGEVTQRIVMKTYFLGGGFGRRLNGDYILPAVLASRQLGGRPVKLIFTREDDMKFDSVRAPSLQRLTAALDPETRRLSAMAYTTVTGWPSKALVPDDKGLLHGVNGLYDPDSVGGAEPWYTVGPYRLRAICNDLTQKTIRPGWLRSVGPGWTNWALESFIDEAALMAGCDPVAFRLSMLLPVGPNAGGPPDAVGGASRQAAVLKALAERIGWPCRDLPPDTGIGIASGYGQSREMPTWGATAALVHVDRRTGVVTCRKLWLVLDAGTIVNEDGARAQCEGAALWGVSMALHEGTEIRHGNIAARNLDTYTPLRISETPALDIAFLKTPYPPTGLGEPGVTLVAPAIGNAIHAAVGARVRRLPIRPQEVLEALSDSAPPA